MEPGAVQALVPRMLAVMPGQVLTETDTCWPWRFKACPCSQLIVPQLRMQTLRVYRCSLYGSRIRFTHCSNDASLASASATIGTASASCCKVRTAPYGRFPHNGPILRAWIPRLSWVMGVRFYAPSI